MPVELIINSCNFYNQLKSGYKFTSLTDPVTNLVGNIGDRIKMVASVDVRWYFASSVANGIQISGAGTVFTRASGSWIDDGFAVGDTISLYYYDSLNVYHGLYTGTIASLSDLTLIPTSPIVTYNGDGSYSVMTIYGTTALTSLIYKFGLIENNETFNILSKISNNEQVYYIGGIDVTPAYTQSSMLSLGNYKEWISGVGDGSGTTAWVTYAGTSGQYQRFTIEHVFVINPFYLESWLSNFEDGTVPDLLNGLNSLKYAFEFEFRTLLSNPNTSKIARIENNLGSVGWFDENYNGFNNLYSIDSIVYTDTVSGASCDGLQKGSMTKVVITVNGTFNLGDNYGLIVTMCTGEDKYISTSNNLEKIFLFDDLIFEENGGYVGGSYNGIISSVAANIVGSQLVITANIVYSSTQQLQIITDSKYIIGVIVADDTLSYGSSDKVTLLADYNTYVDSADITDLMYVTGFEMFQHFVTDPTVVTGTTKADIWNEDGLCFKFDFWIDLNLDALLNSLKFLVIAYDSTTGDYFILDQYSVNMNNVIISGGVQQINISDSRGYKLNASDYFDKVVITTETNIAGKQYYKMYIGQKTSWQDWLLNTDVDTVFYDSSKPNNNLNYKASNYSNLNNYQIKFALLANIYGTNTIGISGNTDYLILSPDITTYDYDLPATWTSTMQTFTEDESVDLDLAIRTDANTLFRVRWARISAFNVGYNFWAIHRIEESQESGKNIYELSSVISSISNNILKPVSGSTLLKVTVDPFTTTVITDCLIDYTKLDKTKSYKISARLDDGTAVPYIPVGKLTEDGTIKITEDGQVKIIE
jgi:hypothetical protein